jgi:hypothetical protein
LHRAGAQQRIPEITNAIAVTGNTGVQTAGAPAWVAFAAHQSGIAPPETATLYRYLRAHLEGTQPTSIVTIPLILFTKAGQ